MVTNAHLSASWGQTQCGQLSHVPTLCLPHHDELFSLESGAQIDHPLNWSSRVPCHLNVTMGLREWIPAGPHRGHTEVSPSHLRSQPLNSYTLSKHGSQSSSRKLYFNICLQHAALNLRLGSGSQLCTEPPLSTYPRHSQGTKRQRALELWTHSSNNHLSRPQEALWTCWVTRN